MTASSLRAEISDLTRTLVQARNDVAQLEREGFLVHLQQQCDDLGALIAVLSREQPSSSSPSSLSRKFTLSRSPGPSRHSRHRFTKHGEGDPYCRKCSLSTLPSWYRSRLPHGGNPHRRLGEKLRTRGSFIFEFHQRDVTDGTRSPWNIPLMLSQSHPYCREGPNRERSIAFILNSAREM